MLHLRRDDPHRVTPRRHRQPREVPDVAGVLPRAEVRGALVALLEGVRHFGDLPDRAPSDEFKQYLVPARSQPLAHGIDDVGLDGEVAAHRIGELPGGRDGQLGERLGAPRDTPPMGRPLASDLAAVDVPRADGQIRAVVEPVQEVANASRRMLAVGIEDDVAVALGAVEALQDRRREAVALAVPYAYAIIRDVAVPDGAGGPVVGRVVDDEDGVVTISDGVPCGFDDGADASSRAFSTRS